jgi:hypothetical protein
MRHLYAKLTCVFLALIFCFVLHCALVTQAEAAQVTVVPTGDSITEAYHNYYPIANTANFFSSTDSDVTFNTFGMPGITAPMYAGHASYQSTVHDYAQDVADANPDVIVFMLGTNDVFYTNGFQDYQTYIPEIFDHWKNVSHVIVASVLPQSSGTYYNNLIDSQYNPFLKQTAADYGFEYLDVNSMLKSLPNWESYYANSTHLNSNPGCSWLAVTMGNAIKADLNTVPEPSAIALLLSASLGVLIYRQRMR